MEVDAADAFNQVSRSSIFGQLALPQFALLRGLANLLRDGTPSYLLGFEPIVQREGVSQGGATSTAFFGLGLHPALVATVSRFDMVRILAYVDNIFLLGPFAQTIEAVDFLSQELSRCGLRYKEAPKVLRCSGSSESQAKSFETKCIFTPGSLNLCAKKLRKS